MMSADIPSPPASPHAGAVAPAAKAAAIDTMAKAAASGAIPTEVVGWVLTASLLTFRQKSWKAVISVEPVFYG